MPKNVSRTAASKKAVAEPEPDGAARLEQAPDKRSKTAPKRSEPASADPSAKNEPVAPIAGSPAEPSAKAPAKGKAKRATSSKKGRLPPCKTFLVAATRADGDGTPSLQVYAAVTRSPAEALASARAELGADVAVELTGKLSNRMAKALGLKPGALHPI